MPVRPDRRGSARTILVGKSELANLMKLDNEPEHTIPPAKLDNFLEENKNDDAQDFNESAAFNQNGLVSEQVLVSSPILAPLKDEVNDQFVPAMAAIPEDRRKAGNRQRERRGSNDMMPIRPDRRTSGGTVQVGKGNLADLKKLDGEPEDKPKQQNDDQ